MPLESVEGRRQYILRERAAGGGWWGRDRKKFHRKCKLRLKEWIELTNQTERGRAETCLLWGLGCSAFPSAPFPPLPGPLASGGLILKSCWFLPWSSEDLDIWLTVTLSNTAVILQLLQWPFKTPRYKFMFPSFQLPFLSPHLALNLMKTSICVSQSWATL